MKIFLSVLVFQLLFWHMDGTCEKIIPSCPNPYVKFWLYTKMTQNSPHRLEVFNPKTFKDAVFNITHSTKILIHGYSGWKDSAPSNSIRPALFQHGEYNVISLDYNRFAKSPCYFQAVQNAVVVANCTAQLIDVLVKNLSMNMNKLHIIGFSLGAHVAGMTATFLRSGKIARITGLDPAMPLFIRTPKWGRLDKGDALFVDVIHTDGFVKGQIERSGHVNFYANGGLSQPGCEKPINQSKSSCNHNRAPAYYAESINTNTGFWAVPCRNWLEYRMEKCKKNSNNQVLIGEHTTKSTRGAYFFNTASHPPYAIGLKSNITREVTKLNGFSMELNRTV